MVNHYFNPYEAAAIMAQYLGSEWAVRVTADWLIQMSSGRFAYRIQACPEQLKTEPYPYRYLCQEYANKAVRFKPKSIVIESQAQNVA